MCTSVFCLHVRLCTPCKPDVQGGQKRASDSPELELQITVKHQVGIRNWILVRWKGSKCPLTLSHISSFIGNWFYSLVTPRDQPVPCFIQQELGMWMWTFCQVHLWESRTGGRRGWEQRLRFRLLTVYCVTTLMVAAVCTATGGRCQAPWSLLDSCDARGMLLFSVLW